MSSGLRVILSGLIVVGASCVLVGCTPASNLAVKIDDGTLLVATCDKVDSTEVGAWVSEPGEDAQTVWVAEGTHSFVSGDVFAYGTAPKGMEDDTPAQPLPSRGRVGVHVLGEPGSLRGTFDIEVLDDGDWHVADGSVRANPC